MISTTLDKRIRKILFVIIWLVIWQVLASAVGNPVLLAGPWETFCTLKDLILQASFWLSVLLTACKIALGFLTGVITGVLLAWISYRFMRFREFIAPFVSVVKSIPVASFVILILIWIGAPMLSTVISALVVFPLIYLNCLEGLLATDNKLLQMAAVFGMPKRYKLRYIYLKSLSPFLKSSLSISAGMSWKSGIAAEVIGRPLYSIGNGIYLSKIYINTGELFAWTFTAVLCAWLFEKGIRAICSRWLR